MRQNSFLSIAIFALNCSTEEGERALLEAAGLTANKPLLGVYRGQAERSWLVPTTSPEHKAAVLSLAKVYGQESVLFSGIDRTCHLHYIGSGEVVPLGLLTDVPEDYAKQQDSYTYDPESDSYYVAR